MTSVLGNLTKLAEYIAECNRLSIKVLPPDINQSYTYFHPHGKDIVFGLLALKNVGKQFVENIVKERSLGKFTDFEDFVQRMAEYDLNKRMVEGLIKCGAFDGLGVYRSRLLASFERLIDIRTEKNKSNISGQLDMFSSVFVGAASAEAPKFEYPNLPDLTLKEKLMLEKESSGMYFSGHLIDSYSEQVSHLDVKRISELLDGEAVTEKQSVKLCGIVSSVTTKITRKNEKMAFIKLEDRYGEIECLIFPNKYAQNYQYIRVDAPLYIEGTVSLREDEDPKILVNVIDELTDNARFSQATALQKNNIAVTEKKAQAVTTEKRITKLYLRVPDTSCLEYLKAKNIVDIFEGSVRVIFYSRETSSYIDYPSGLALTEYILSELKEILGEDNVVPK